jgi:arsenate reductase
VRVSEPRILNVLFLCTGNSARSVMCEAYMNAKGAKRFRAFSAGSHPAGAVNPLTLETLQASGLSADGYRSKSWDEFASADSPKMDFVITVCDQAAGEICPIWPGQPISAHWGFPDPASFEGADEDKRRFFKEVFRQIRNRLDLLLALPIERLNRIALKQEVDDIGRSGV